MLKNKRHIKIFLICLGLICLIAAGCSPLPDAIEKKSEAAAGFSFIFMGDTQADPETEDYTAWGQLLKRAAAEKSKPVFIMISGDLVNDGSDQAEWKRFFAAGGNALKKLHLYPAPGNHDSTSLYKSIFYLPDNGPENYKETFYSFDYGEVHFTILDSNEMESANPELVDWLKRDLSTTGAAYKIVMFHHPAYSALADDEANTRMETIRTTFVPVMEEEGVNLVLNGHQHVYMRTYPILNGKRDEKGIVYLTGNSSGKYYEPGEFDYAASIIGNQPVYTIFTVTATGIKLETKSSNGIVLDSSYLKNRHRGLK